MEQFIGIKIISAKPMTRAEFVAYRYPNQPHNPDAGNPEDAGYLVEYHDGGTSNHPDHKGYISWSPKDVFDAAYVGMGVVSHVVPHLQRVIGEKADLDNKLQKLNEFFDTERFAGLDHDERQRMEDQADYMQSYSDVLRARLTAAIPGYGAQIYPSLTPAG